MKQLQMCLMAGLIASGALMSGCSKGADIAKTLLVSGIGVATAVIGDQINASKHVGISHKKRARKRRRRSKESKSVYVDAPKSVKVDTVVERSSRTTD